MILFIIIIFFVICFKCCSGCSSSSSDSSSNDIDITLMTDAQQEVEKKLVSPSSAKFPWGKDEYTFTELGEGSHSGYKKYKVTGHVDSENALGVSIRSNFTVILEAKDDSYYCISCDVN